MSLFEDIDKIMKAQPGKRYRLVRLDPANMSDRVYKGYELVTKGDPEVKDTLLEKHVDGESHVRVGGLALARISEKRAREIDAKKHEKLEKRMKSIREGYLVAGENIKRKLGPAHKGFKTIVQEEE